MHTLYPSDDAEIVPLAMALYDELSGGSPSPAIVGKRSWQVIGYIAGKITGDPDAGIVMTAPADGEIELNPDVARSLRQLAAASKLPGVEDCGPCPAVVGSNAGAVKVKIPWLKLLLQALQLLGPLFLDEKTP
jgi:hypothetical protein